MSSKKDNKKLPPKSEIGKRLKKQFFDFISLNNLYFIILLIVLIVLIVIRWDFINSNEPGIVDITLFAGLVILLIAPLFHEISFLGIEVKREIKKVKQEVKQTSLDMKIAFMNLQQNVNLQNQNTIVNVTTLSQQERQKLSDQLKITPEKTLDKSKNFNIPRLKNIKIDDGTIYLAKIRITIENFLHMILDTIKYLPDRRNRSAGYYLKTLLTQELISFPIYEKIRFVLSICNKAIHTNSYNVKELFYVQDVSMDILEELDKILDDNLINGVVSI